VDRKGTATKPPKGRGKAKACREEPTSNLKNPAAEKRERNGDNDQKTLGMGGKEVEPLHPESCFASV